jgi:hypothetical protein
VARMVEPLRCNPEGRGFDSRWSHWDFSVTSFRPHYDLGIDSSSNRNEYQEYFVGGKGGWCLGLTTFPPPCSDCLKTSTLKPQPPGTLRTCPGLVMGLLHLFTGFLRAGNATALPPRLACGGGMA